ncbi:response regulator [Achromobacter aloeverae]
MRVLVIEDNQLVAKGLMSGLRLHDFTPHHAGSAAQAESAVALAPFDICVLDLGLPDGDGIDLLTKWRALGVRLPTLILSARDAVDHRIRGLRAGADDYLVKPFDLDELVARLHAIARRANGHADDTIRHGRLTCNVAAGKVWLDDEEVELPRRELTLLMSFLKHPDHILSTGQLHDSIYGMDEAVASNALNVHIHHLRRKLGADIIQTVRGLGYRLGEAGE